MRRGNRAGRLPGAWLRSGSGEMTVGAKGTGASRRHGIALGLFLVAAVVSAVGAGTAMAAGGDSVNFAMTIDAVTSGGGRSASASYHESDSAIGEAAYGFSAGGAHNNQAGVVQAWGDVDLPAVVGITALTTRTVQIAFSELMGVGVTDPTNYTLTGDGQGTLAEHPDHVECVADTMYLLTWDTGATVGDSTITITVASAARDFAGNPMGPLNSASCPTVSDLVEFLVPFFLSAFALWYGRQQE